jgi:dTMP kinase
MARGRFIVLEGVEGAGKSTQARALGRWIQERGLAHTLAREPGGTPVGEAIRRVVLDRGGLAMPPETELFLILAARAAFVREVALPALARGEIVLADRFDLSTFAYQGYGRGLELTEIRRANALATGGLAPDLYMVLDVPVEEGLRRKGSSGGADRIEREGAAFLGRVREGYLSLARSDPRAVLVDARGDRTGLAAELRRILEGRFPETFQGARV